MIGLVFGVLSLIAGLVVLGFTLLVAVQDPLVAALVLLPPAVVLFGWLYVRAGQERLRKALFLSDLERSRKFRRG